MNLPKFPNPLEPVFAHIHQVNSLGNSQWYEVVYHDGEYWCSYSGSDTFNGYETVLDWKYPDFDIKTDSELKYPKIQAMKNQQTNQEFPNEFQQVLAKISRDYPDNKSVYFDLIMRDSGFWVKASTEVPLFPTETVICWEFCSNLLPDDKPMQESQSMQDAINANMNPVEPAKTGTITQETYQDLKHLVRILDTIKNLESQIETLSQEYDDTEKRIIDSLFKTGVFGTGLYANNADNVALVDDILVTCEYQDGWALGIQKVNKPEIES